jgi:hypothetical protein
VICPACNTPFSTADTCVHRTGLVTRTEERRWMVSQYPEWADIDFAERCRDCNARPDGYHHPVCSQAACILHEEQRLTCPCDDALLDHA